MSPKVGGMARLKLKAQIWDMISQCAGRQAILNQLQMGGLTMLAAEQLHAEVWRDIRTVEEQSLPERRQRLLATLEAVVHGAFAEKQYAAVVAAVREIKKMFGVDAPTKFQPIAPGAATYFAGRTDEELEYHLEHGCWPEEVAAQAKAAEQTRHERERSPLDRLQ